MVSGELADVTSSWLLAVFSTGFFSTIGISVILSDKKGSTDTPAARHREPPNSFHVGALLGSWPDI
ncbi:hypothetical protein [Rhodomicrobium lacus]|uniref:hypothetical protein n=1 Tax=Rhodomicrobium lacus TaxID=2498452 RepID=UPI0026E275A7|nr:hypothetical protein [Rhodomicrobium lacus]WKW50143.1 hypothetical protein QMO75_12720 [Rhodomicrobium lacus]